MSSKQELHNKLATIPMQPGVYQMLDAGGKVIYVGKAKNLRRRVASYFRAAGPESPLTRLLVKQIEDIRCTVTKSEIEALLLENNLIKQDRPKYNIRLRDDKDFICLRLSVKHPFPRLTVVRRPRPDGAKYFGPYVSGWAMKQLTRYLLKVFPLRSCSDATLNNRSRPCILYDIKLCTAPCVGKIAPPDYAELVREVRLFLEGHTAPLKRQLKAAMRKAANNLDYRTAATLRDRLRDLELARTEQHVVFHDRRDLDVVGIAPSSEIDHDQGELAVVILTVRDGRIIGKREILCEHTDREHRGQTVETILIQHYLERMSFIPPTILLSIDLPSQTALEQLLSQKAEAQIKLRSPKRGGKRKLLELANENAAIYLEQSRKIAQSKQSALVELKNILTLVKLPERIEAFDISNLQGTDPTASQVTFVNGEPDKHEYRRYRIQSVAGANDFAMLQEVLRRRFAKDKREGKADPKRAYILPDLVLIDGGKGQLSAASAVLRELKLTQLPIAAIAKIPAKLPVDAKAKRIVTDRIFIPGRKNPLNLKPNNPGLRLLQRLRDEAHRFALAYHRKRRSKRMLT